MAYTEEPAMRLSRPIYESLPLIYALIGAAAIWLFFHSNPLGFGGKAAFIIGFFAEIAALTLFLRRKDYRTLSREYNGETIDLPSNLNR
jgi:hypothetical protein